MVSWDVCEQKANIDCASEDPFPISVFCSNPVQVLECVLKTTEANLWLSKCFALRTGTELLSVLLNSTHVLLLQGFLLFSRVSICLKSFKLQLALKFPFFVLELLSFIFSYTLALIFVYGIFWNFGVIQNGWQSWSLLAEMASPPENSTRSLNFMKICRNYAL